MPVRNRSARGATVCLSLLLLCFGASSQAAEDELRCLDATEPIEPAVVVYERLKERAFAALDRREESVEQLQSLEAIAEYQQRMRAFFLRQLGTLPQRSPLNAEVLGTIEGEGYRIERILFESRPHHHVTALLYLPGGPPPYPGVVVSSGHSRTAKTAAYNQRFGIALAQHGLAALCFDPIGQGERSQILAEDGSARFSSTTQEHLLIGVGAMLLGTNTAQYRVWDGMRAIDYLVSREDIDGERIGYTGCSGGGTLTSYVMALDDRVACAAPACYLTTFRQLLSTIGPQDAEQNIFGQLQFGMDQPDYVLMRAPKPTLISATTGDFFPIRGTWDVLREAKRVYARLGYAERVDLVEADGEHGVQPENLLAIVRWMRRWLLQADDAIDLGELRTLSDNELLCTATGQVLQLKDERSVFQLQAEQEQQLAVRRRELWGASSRDELLRQVRELSGVRPLEDIPRPAVEKRGRVQREGYHIDKLVLRTADGVPLPLLTYHPAEPLPDAYLYVHSAGKSVDGGSGGAIERLVEQGYVVVAVDARGWGETSSSEQHPLLGDWKTAYMAYLVGQSLVGLRAEDVLTCGHWVANYETQEPRHVHLVAVGAAGIAALHAAALQPDLFASTRLRDVPESWSSQIGRPLPALMPADVVHGALTVYDLPDLERLVPQLEREPQ